jgi:hypothetical protein
MQQSFCPGCLRSLYYKLLTVNPTARRAVAEPSIPNDRGPKH